MPMLKRSFVNFVYLVTALTPLLAFGCATTGGQPVSVTAAERAAVQEPGRFSGDLQAGSFESFTSMVEWPDEPVAGECSASNIASTVDGGVLIEGRAYVRRTLDEMYSDLVTPGVIGPAHIATEIVQDGLVETPSRTSFVLHNQIRYIISLALDLEWVIEPVFDDGQHVGFYATAEKIGGTNQLMQISNRVLVREVRPGLESVELRSFNRATMNKEAESRAYVEKLFGYWEGACAAKSGDGVAETPAGI